MILITRKFLFTFSFRVRDSEILLYLFFGVNNSEIVFFFKPRVTNSEFISKFFSHQVTNSKNKKIYIVSNSFRDAISFVTREL